MSGGKRLRPVLTLLTARATGASEARKRTSKIPNKNGRVHEGCIYMGVSNNSGIPNMDGL